jgi:hypothetical protein
MTATRHALLLKNEDEILDFITGGKAIFTIKNKGTGVRATYRVEAEGEGDARTYTVMAFTGSDNNLKTSYTAMGDIDADGFFTARTAESEIKDLQAAIARKAKGHWVDNKPGFLTHIADYLTKGWSLTANQKYRYNAALNVYGIGRHVSDKVKLVVFPWTWGRLTSGKGLPDGIEVWHEGCCKHCGLKLTVPASIELGKGWDCASQRGQAKDWEELNRLLGDDLEAYMADKARPDAA